MPAARLHLADRVATMALPSIADVAALPVDELPPLLGQLEVLRHVALARLVAPAADSVCTTPSATEPQPLLTIREAAALLAVSTDWLRRRPNLPFVVKLSDGVVRYDRQRLVAYVARQAAR